MLTMHPEARRKVVRLLGEIVEGLEGSAEVSVGVHAVGAGGIWFVS
jgi:hypothetical protein